MPTRTEEDAFFAEELRVQQSSDRSPLLRKAEAIRAALFPEQRDFVDDPHDRKALLTPRRAGKSEAELADKTIKAVRGGTPGAEMVYCCPTREWAERNMWERLHEYDDRFSIGFKFNKTALSATLEKTEAKIRLAGCENEHDAEKFRGPKYADFTFDETASFKPRLLAYAIDQVIDPALNDVNGTLKMMGSPGHVLKGLFYDATGSDVESLKEREEDAEKSAAGRWFKHRGDPKWGALPWTWSSHWWSLQQNVKQPHLWLRALEKKRRRGWTDQNPIWQRESLGRWVADFSQQIYKYLAARNAWHPKTLRLPNGALSAIHALPEGHLWRFVIGLDLGYDDPFALQVAAYADDCPRFYQCYEFSSPGLILPRQVEALKQAIETIERNGGAVERIVGDRAGGGGKVVIETMNQMEGFGIEGAKKHDKADNRDLLNSDLVDARCMVMADSELAAEFEMFYFDEDGNEPDSIPNDNIDAFLYLATAAQHRFATERDRMIPDIRTAEEADRQREQQEIQRIVEEERRAREPDGFGDGVEADGEYEWERHR